MPATEAYVQAFIRAGGTFSPKTPVRALLRDGDQAAALACWRDLAAVPRLLFAEPSPAPIKHWLWRAGLIASPEVLLPMTGVSPALAARIDAEMQRRGALGAEAAVA